jgi:hypothetical protein
MLFSSPAQRRGFRDYLQGLLLPRDRNKTLTGLAGAEPITGAQHREVQRLQWFLSESAWDHDQVTSAAWACSARTQPPPHMPRARWCSMTLATARTAPPPPCGPPVPGVGRQDRQRHRRRH